MKIGIIGSGVVGRVLATAFLKEDHDVMLGSRNASKKELADWKMENAKGRTGNFSETAAFGELLVLVTAGHAAQEAVQLAGIDNFKSKIVIDATNPIAGPPVNGVMPYFTGPNESLMERIQKLLPGAHLVKAFNSVGNALFYKPGFKGIKPTMFICGNSDEARKKVSTILESFGWEAMDFGKAESARAIEPLAILWCIRGFNNNQWTHAFKVLQQ